jgi:hypothetical protein
VAYQFSTDTWVKLFGSMGLMLVFIVARASGCRAISGNPVRIATAPRTHRFRTEQKEIRMAADPATIEALLQAALIPP